MQRWEPFPTAMDGISHPHAWVAGWHGDLFAHVQDAHRHYGVRFPDTRAWSGFTETSYSMGTANDDGGTYDGGVYLKTARSSAFLASVQDVEWIVDDPLKVFLIVGSDCCYEVVCVDDPVIVEMPSFEAARDWAIARASGKAEHAV